MTPQIDGPAPDAGQEPAAPRRRSPRRKLGQYTIHDVAALAGVSSITVSRYFRAPHKVSEAMQARLREVIAETGYVPSQMAGRLASAQSRVVGAVMQNTATVTFAELVRGMSEGLEEGGLQLLLANTNYSRQRETRAIEAFAGWHPSALIVTRDDHEPQAEAALRALRSPVVETWGVVPGRPFHQVGFPHSEVGVQLTEHFLAQGVHRIRFAVRNVAQDFRARQRTLGYEAAMRDAGLVPDVQYSDSEDEMQAGADLLARYAAEPAAQRPRAIIFASDNMAAGAILQAGRLGLRLPRDCAVAGFGDAAVGSWLEPTLTTVKPEPYRIGATVARLVTDLVAHPDPQRPPETHLVPCRLVVRESSRVMA
ncbi:LacI family DNA-binding transcriptional regulator [Orrella sp. JC864]|uniref:LacI family DNA-binding transcriptional regulator n=1 Tax=Orrella sp. JC864 TaxID=3120298 RepID=UPI0012BB79E6